jgi:hypothetical protein
VDWIKRARTVKYAPSITNGAQYGREWVRWWRELQPLRRKGNNGMLERETCDPTVVVVGPNGLLSVIQTLAWWRKSITTTTDVSAWHDAVSDVIWVLENFE